MSCIGSAKLMLLALHDVESGIEVGGNGLELNIRSGARFQGLGDGMHCSGFGSQAFGGQPGLKVVHICIDTHICIYI